MSIRLLGIALAISALAGCATVDLQNPTSVSKSVQVVRDDSGPYMPLGFGDGGAYLRGFEASKAEVKPLVEPTVQLVISVRPSHPEALCSGVGAAHAAQFSNGKPSMRANSRRLLVTSVQPSLKAWQAIHKSLPPMGVPAALSRRNCAA